MPVYVFGHRNPDTDAILQAPLLMRIFCDKPLGLMRLQLVVGHPTKERNLYLGKRV